MSAEKNPSRRMLVSTVPSLWSMNKVWWYTMLVPLPSLQLPNCIRKKKLENTWNGFLLPLFHISSCCNLPGRYYATFQEGGLLFAFSSGKWSMWTPWKGEVGTFVEFWKRKVKNHTIMNAKRKMIHILAN